MLQLTGEVYPPMCTMCVAKFECRGMPENFAYLFLKHSLFPQNSFPPASLFRLNPRAAPNCTSFVVDCQTAYAPLSPSTVGQHAFAPPSLSTTRPHASAPLLMSTIRLHLRLLHCRLPDRICISSSSIDGPHVRLLHR